MTIYEYFLLFIIYSTCGWIMEVVLSFIQHKKFINRGFLIGPYCPIYGCGAIIMTLTLNKYLNDWLALFMMAILVCSILEYSTSYFMEKIFHARWWDYNKKKFNINGRICLETMIPFGIMGCLAMYVVNPFFISLLRMIPETILILISCIIFVIFVVDNIVSFKIISNFTKTTKKVAKDSTEEITKKVREILLSKSALSRRLVNAFPRFRVGFKNVVNNRRKGDKNDK